MKRKSWDDYPHLLADLDMTKNKNLTYKGKLINVLNISPGTKYKIDWNCSTCDHEWRTTGSSRIQGCGCPFCAGQRLHSDGRNSMFNTHPELAKEYQGDANLIMAGTNKKLDWNCSACEHDWTVSGNSRVSGTTGCPACANQVIHSDGRNSMFNTHPFLAKEYQGDANLIVAGTNKKLDWKCSTCEHEWKLGGNGRVSKGSGCPACAGRLHSDGRNSMFNTHPELAKEYQGDAKLIIAGTNDKIDWKCSACEHEWNTTGSHRTVCGTGCPACFGQLHSDGRNSMLNTHPELAKEYQGNSNLIIAGICKIISWKCSTCEHEWRASGDNRVRGTSCPSCNGGIHSDGRNSMANTHPELALEYQGDANLITAKKDSKLDWKCSTCEFEWRAIGYSRFIGSGCPSCALSGYDPSKIGYVYIHQYVDDTTHWLKCGITGKPVDRFKQLSRAASRVNIEVQQLDIYTFDDGWIAQQCERELLDTLELRFNSEYDIDGKAEFFKYSALEEVRRIIGKYL